MARPSKIDRRRRATQVGLSSAPHNYVFGMQHIPPTEHRLVSTLRYAGDELAAMLAPPEQSEPEATYAVPVDDSRAAYFEDCAELLDIVARIRAWTERSDTHAEALRQLAAAMGDGELLKVLFCSQFPDQPARPVHKPENVPELTEQEKKVLREAAADRSHEEIAARLGIAKFTVDTHFKNIYAKLKVKRPMQAVTLAIARGFLDISVLDFITLASGCAPRDFGPLDWLLSQPVGKQEKFQTAGLDKIAAFGLLLMAISSTTCRTLEFHRIHSVHRGGQVYQIDAQGRVLQVFDSERFCETKDVIVAPAHASRQGFTPGHLFVLNNWTVPRRLNYAEIVEFTPTGEFVRAFHGGKDARTHLGGGCNLAFARDGSLLASTDNCLLRFRQSGREVKALVGCSLGVCTGNSNQFYAAQYSSLGCLISVHNMDGDLLRSIGGAEAAFAYYGLAVNSRGHLFVVRSHAGSGVLERYDEEGIFKGEIPVEGLNNPNIAIDAEDRLYIPCQRDKTIKILSPEGRVEQTIPVTCPIVPHSVSPAADGTLYMCGSPAQI